MTRVRRQGTNFYPSQIRQQSVPFVPDAHPVDEATEVTMDRGWSVYARNLGHFLLENWKVWLALAVAVANLIRR
jgi:hypothetical protein